MTLRNVYKSRRLDRFAFEGVPVAKGIRYIQKEVNTFIEETGVDRGTVRLELEVNEQWDVCSINMTLTGNRPTTAKEKRDAKTQQAEADAAHIERLEDQLRRLKGKS